MTGFELCVLFFKDQPGGFFLDHLLFGADSVADKKENDDSNNHQNDRNEQEHMIPEYIHQAVGVQILRIAIGSVLRIVVADHIDTAVQQLEKSFVSDLNAETVIVALRQLVKLQILIL